MIHVLVLDDQDIGEAGNHICLFVFQEFAMIQS